MRIAIDARKIESPLTGIGRYTKNVLTHLSHLDKVNEYFILQRKGLNHRFTQAENFRTISVDFPAFSIRSLFFLHRVLHREKIDLFHSPFVCLPLFAKCKTILTVYDLNPLKFPKSFGTKKSLAWLLRKFVFKLILLAVIEKADYIITVSKATKKTLLGLDDNLGNKITVVYGAPEEIFKPLSNEEEKKKIKVRIGSRRKLIFYVGMIRPHKNLTRILEAINLLIHEKKRECNLVIAGGEEKAVFFLRKLAEKLNISEYVFFVGSLTDSEIVTWMNVADVLVFPSLEEGFGLPPLEAMACGTPVITSNVSSLPEVVGDAALLVDPYNEKEIANAIEGLWTQDHLWHELKRKGFKRVKLFSWEKAAQRTLEVYNQVGKKQ